MMFYQSHLLNKFVLNRKNYYYINETFSSKTKSNQTNKKIDRFNNIDKKLINSGTDRI